MQLIQARFVTEDVGPLATFYSALLGRRTTLNDYYVELPAGAATLGFSRCRFTEDNSPHSGCGPQFAARAGEIITDFRVADVDAEFARVDALGVQWIFGPTTQPWGARSMMLRDPEGHLVNIIAALERDIS
jgi:catechol 2,3-dioxygenase-like lactoylglutathione lyase family enzyme